MGKPLGGGGEDGEEAGGWPGPEDFSLNCCGVRDSPSEAEETRLTGLQGGHGGRGAGGRQQPRGDLSSAPSDVRLERPPTCGKGWVLAGTDACLGARVGGRGGVGKHGDVPPQHQAGPPQHVHRGRRTRPPGSHSPGANRRSQHLVHGARPLAVGVPGGWSRSRASFGFEIC